jgi:hypothetical protein
MNKIFLSCWGGDPYQTLYISDELKEELKDDYYLQNIIFELIGSNDLIISYLHNNNEPSTIVTLKLIKNNYYLIFIQFEKDFVPRQFVKVKAAFIRNEIFKNKFTIDLPTLYRVIKSDFFSIKDKPAQLEIDLESINTINNDFEFKSEFLDAVHDILNGEKYSQNLVLEDLLKIYMLLPNCIKIDKYLSYNHLPKTTENIFISNLNIADQTFCYKINKIDEYMKKLRNLFNDNNKFLNQADIFELTDNDEFIKINDKNYKNNQFGQFAFLLLSSLFILSIVTKFIWDKNKYDERNKNKNEFIKLLLLIKNKGIDKFDSNDQIVSELSDDDGRVILDEFYKNISQDESTPIDKQDSIEINSKYMDFYYYHLTNYQKFDLSKLKPDDNKNFEKFCLSIYSFTDDLINKLNEKKDKSNLEKLFNDYYININKNKKNDKITDCYNFTKENIKLIFEIINFNKWYPDFSSEDAKLELENLKKNSPNKIVLINKIKIIHDKVNDIRKYLSI